MDTIPSKGGRGNGAGRNARWLNIGRMEILFSYKTPVAFKRGAMCTRREHISKTTSDQLSSVGAGGWPIKKGVEFEQELEAQLFVEINGWPEGCDFLSAKGITSKVVFDLVWWLQLITSTTWYRPTKLREAVGLLADEVLRQFITAKRKASRFDGAIRRKLMALIAEEASHREQIAAQTKSPSSRGTTGDEDGEA